MKKFIYQIENPEVRNRQEQTGIDKNKQDYVSDIENCCIIKKFIYQIGNL